jgi:hypothetical protein
MASDEVTVIKQGWLLKRGVLYRAPWSYQSPRSCDNIP